MQLKYPPRRDKAKFSVTIVEWRRTCYNIQKIPEVRYGKVYCYIKLPCPLARVEEFLQKPLTLDLPEGDTIRQFVTKTLMPLDSLENFKVCLGRLWVNTDVRVEWSMPPGAMAEL